MHTQQLASLHNSLHLCKTACKMEKTYHRDEDGDECLAVILHEGYGGGTPDEMRFGNRKLIGMLEADERDVDAIVALIKSAFGININKHTVSKLMVEWVPKGEKFRITEYDGWESIEYLKDIIEQFTTA